MSDYRYIGSLVSRFDVAMSAFTEQTGVISSAPYAFAQVGYWPGCVVFFTFGVLAGFTGYLLMYMYGKLDSPQYPIRHFGDLAERIFGKWARHGKLFKLCEQKTYVDAHGYGYQCATSCKVYS